MAYGANNTNMSRACQVARPVMWHTSFQLQYEFHTDLEMSGEIMAEFRFSFWVNFIVMVKIYLYGLLNIDKILTWFQNFSDYVQISGALEQTRISSEYVDYSKISNADLEKLDVRVCQACVSDMSPGVSCDGYSYGDECLDLFLWCRDEFVVRCSHELRSDDQLLWANLW